jgi:hypothetical protein
MSQNDNPCFKRAGSLAEGLVQLQRSPGFIALGDNHHERRLAALFQHSDVLDESINVCRSFRQASKLGSRRQGGVCRDVAAVPAHDFDKKQSFVALGRIPQLIDSAHRGGNGRVKPNRRIRAQQIIINCSWTANDLTGPGEGQCDGTPECPIASNWDQGINAMLPQNLGCLFLAFNCPESFTTTGVQ